MTRSNMQVNYLGQWRKPLEDVDRQEYPAIFAAAPILRQKLEQLRDELRGGTVN